MNIYFAYTSKFNSQIIHHLFQDLSPIRRLFGYDDDDDDDYDDDYDDDDYI